MRSNNCQIFTPNEYVELLLEEIGYTKDIYGKKVLENSFGNGNVLKLIVKRYVHEGVKLSKSPNEIKKSIEENIYGFEIDEKYILESKDILDELVEQYGLYGVNWNLIQGDYLKSNLQFKFSFIIGNPPYIKYHDLENEEREFLRKNFNSCNHGKFDYCYPFIEKSVADLDRNGKLAYIIPNSIFKNVFGSNLRKIIKPYVISIIDFKNIRIFEDALTSSAMLFVKKREDINHFEYFNVDEKKQISINKNQLEDKWVFSNEKKRKLETRFGDNYAISNTIATQLNKAFVISKFIEIDEDFILVGDKIIEKKLLKKTGSPKRLSKNEREYLIFPYKYQNGILNRYTDEEFQNNFPNGKIYLEQFREELDKRDSDKSSKWFEYGRSQALQHMNKEKLLISSIVTNSMKVYFLDENTIPYSGFYIISKDGRGLGEAADILNSKSFFKYLSNIGINASGTSVRITVKDVLNYRY